ncbi:MAG: IS21-like element helper ATPase IstB [Acidimicrobiia bacterium]|nr:IS21-like element helper ATPase IstB [Acidimicrobiia bacterium]
MTVLTEQAADAAIVAAATTLALPTVRAQAAQIADAAARDQLTHRGYLAELLATEVDDRTERRRARRIREAHFPRLKHLNEFDTTISPIDPATIGTLTQGNFIKAGTPVVFLGDSGTGKTHLMIGTGIAACHTGLSVRYTTAAGLVNELVEAQDEHTLSRLVGRYGRLDLLLIDELGYLHLDPRGAELLFQVITEREERASIAVATNAPFSEWAATFTDPRLCSAIIDRLTFKANIIETGTDSYRLAATTRTAKTGTTK